MYSKYFEVSVALKRNFIDNDRGKMKIQFFVEKFCDHFVVHLWMAFRTIWTLFVAVTKSIFVDQIVISSV